jgi:hypothetical protein
MDETGRCDLEGSGPSCLRKTTSISGALTIVWGYGFCAIAADSTAALLVIGGEEGLKSLAYTIAVFQDRPWNRGSGPSKPAQPRLPEKAYVRLEPVHFLHSPSNAPKSKYCAAGHMTGMPGRTSPLCIQRDAAV